MATAFNPIDRDALRDRVRKAQPFPHFCIDDFLVGPFAEEVRSSFPSFEEAGRIGRKFAAVNEREKVQVTDASLFAGPIAALNRALDSPEFRELLSYVFDIPDLIEDEELIGGGMHQTGPRGHLDVHVDFNYIEDRRLFRRLNILIYFNKGWRPEWGGNIELWDEDVKECHVSLSPIFNRCVVFATSEISYHGVTAVTCPPGESRKSFASYYYTREAPAGWDGKHHSTVFKARPDEILKGKLFMPMEHAKRKVLGALHEIKKTIKG
jgi:hypothetical protein